jgi:hypothetical protein
MAKGRWERLRTALHRDWEQTKADFSTHHGQELNQGALDTLRQATDRASIPPEGMPVSTPTKHPTRHTNAAP